MATKPYWRRMVLIGLLVVGVGLLGIELLTLGQQFVNSPLIDYDLYVQRGLSARQGIFYPPERANPYPLPTTLWIFVPLSFLPSWFKIIWTIGPYLILLALYGRAGVLWWVYYPMMIQGATGQMDGWLIPPLVWLLQDRRWLAGIGAALLLFKPQLAWLPVLLALVLWIKRRDKPNLLAFSALFGVTWGVSFLISPTWPLDLIPPLLWRAQESILPARGATIWGWWWRGGVFVILIPFVLGLALWLAARVFRNKPLETALALDLMTTPVLYASNLLMLIPTVQRRRDIVILIAASWLGVALDGIVGNWGGGYVVLPLTALWLLSQPQLPRLEARLRALAARVQ